MRRAVVLGGLVALVATAPATAGFRPVGGNLNVDPEKSAGGSDIAAVGGVPYVALTDNAGQPPRPLRVRRLNGTSWDFVGGVVAAEPGDSPNIADSGGGLWVTSTEFVNGADQVFVSTFDGTDWVRAANSLNLDATKNAIQPDIAVVESPLTVGVPYVAFSQFASRYELRVKRRAPDGTWETVGGTVPLNVTPGWGAFGANLVVSPGTRFAAGTPYVGWVEVGTSPPPPFPGEPSPDPPLRAYVARGNIASTASESTWSVLGGKLNQSDTASSPSVAVFGGQPWAAWTEEVGGVRRAHVARHEAGTWIPVGSSTLDVDPTNDVGVLHLASVNGTPYLVIDQRLPGAGFHTHVWVKRFDGTNWVTVGGPLNIDPDLRATATGLASVAGVPYVSFIQDAARFQLRVSRLEAPTCQSTTVQVPHNALAFPLSLPCDEGTRRIVSSVSHGVLSDFNAGAGTVNYTPAGGYSGPDSFTFTSSDGALEAAPVTVSIEVAAPPAATSTVATPPGASGGPPGPAAVPRLSALRRTHGVFRVGKARTPLTGRTAARRRRPVPRSTTFSFRLDGPATVTMTIRRVRAGRRVGRRCLAPTRARRNRPRCRRLVTAGRLTREGRAGLNRIRFTGRIGRRALPPGSYRAVFAATNAGGRSPGRTSGFRIVR